jgi:two-component system sensor histidine kinase GlrK
MVIGFGIIVIALIVVYGYILHNLDTVYYTVTSTLGEDVTAIDRAQELHTLLFDEERFALKFFVSGDPSFGSLFQDARKRSREGIDSLGRVINGRRELDIYRRMVAGHDWIGSAVSMNPQSALLREEQITDSMQTLHQHLDLLIRMNQASIARNMAQVENATNRSVGVAVLLILAALLATIIVAFYINRAITHPLSILERGTEQIARGEFTPLPVQSQDEIGKLAEAFNTMNDRIKQVEAYKTDMLHQISHELRTPLQAMYSAHYLLAEQIVGPLTDKQQNLLTTIRDNIDKLSAFSNQFLDLARLEAGMMEFARTPTDLLSVVTPVLNNARVTALQKDITIGLAAQSVPPIYADQDKLSTVVTNLLTNAIKFTPRGGNITVTIGPSPKGVRLAVKDTGIGIDPEDIPKLFTKFFQAKNVSRVKEKGSGVGLALVKAIVDGHGGTVGVTSTPGAGSTFTVEFPATQEEPAWKHALTT